MKTPNSKVLVGTPSTPDTVGCTPSPKRYDYQQHNNNKLGKVKKKKLSISIDIRSIIIGIIIIMKLKSYSWLITILVTCTVGVVKSQNTGRRPCVACPVAERHRLLTAPLFNSYWLQVCKYLPTQLSISPVCLFGPIRPPRNKGITQDVLHFLPRFSWPEVFP